MISKDAPSDAEAARTLAYALLRREPESREAHLKLYEIEQILGNNDAAIAHLRRALKSSRIVTIPATAGPPAVTVLALYRVARWEANCPYELVVDEQRTTVHRVYLEDDDPDDVFDRIALPPHDVVLTAIAESDAAKRTLALAERFAETSRAPVINRPAVIAQLGREGVAQRFAASANVLAPAVVRIWQAHLMRREISDPVVVRPVGSQAGVDLAKLDTVAEIHAYVRAHLHQAYFLMPFVDYKSADGFYRKYRIMFVNRKPIGYHLAISPNWMIHYYNAPMEEHGWMRAEEEKFLGDFGSVFSGRLAAAIGEIAEAIPLGYFGIDCGIAPNGRLLLFEADAAMLVHGTDDPALFGYKRSAFTRVQAALRELTEGTAARTIPVT